MSSKPLSPPAARQLVVLVGCGSKKGTAPARARDLYKGSLFVAGMAHADRLVAANPGARVWILSAKHGLLDPEQVIEPYDKKLTQKREIEAWGDRAFRALRRDHGDLVRVVILAGGTYADPIAYEALLWDRWPHGKGKIVVEKPLDGMTVGARLAWFKAQREATPDAPPASGTVGPVESLLAKVEARLADEKAWTKGELARGDDGEPVGPRSRHAVCWSLDGMLSADERSEDVIADAADLLQKATGIRNASLPDFNDAEKTIIDDVRRVVAKARELARERAS